VGSSPIGGSTLKRDDAMSCIIAIFLSSQTVSLHYARRHYHANHRSGR